MIATVKNYGPKTAYDVKVRLLIDGQLGPDQSIAEIPVGGEATFAFLPGFAPRATTWSRSGSTTTRCRSTTAAAWPCRSARP